ncbi:unnamed protein product [Schistosoma curassoni]|uniref:Endo/exonuclease/phosphatase domain-containing protein n=1 Tax=Schistosoma curassoni TaxID=6186 RepID=A0A183KVC3_9TREM|nr:unnamed protein product [Schistosoma curassoni]
MERPDNVGDREDQSNSNENEEIQIGSTRNQRIALDPSWTAKSRYGRVAASEWTTSYIMGQHGLGERNENGERFANLCAFNKLVIGCTIFPHKRIHKATWISPDHTTENQIDHICINKKFRRTMEDVRTRRGADIASDHHLVVANLELKLKKLDNWTNSTTKVQYSLPPRY